MKRILRIGMDVHSTNYTLCAMEPIIGEDDRIFANIQVTPDYKNILMFIENLKMKLGADNEYDIQCGYEAGCLGYSLYNRLTACGVKCVILAPTSMLTSQGQRVKTDARDDHKLALKKGKQQINAFCLRHGHHYTATKWTLAHLKWLRKLELPSLYRETLDEYMASYEEQTAKIERFDKRIEELAAQERYQEKVKRL